MSESRPKQPARILVFHARKGGLANRLRALVGYRALSRCLGVRFGLAWEVNDWCEAPFEALFRADGVELVAPGDGAEVHEARSWFDAVWETCGRGRVEWSDYIAEVGRCLAELTPVAEIAAQVDRFLEANRPWPRVGVHIRHTDNLQKYEGWT